MDQKTPNGSDKRSWRERLGIGVTKEMPKISEDFKPIADAPAKVETRPVTKPAPMAPRSAVKSAPAAPERIADKLKSQRDASELLAEQRIQAARQRAETKGEGAPLNGNGKPKFAFAEEDADKAAAATPKADAPAPVPPPVAKKPEAQPAPAAPNAVKPEPSKPLAPPPSAGMSVKPLPGAKPNSLPLPNLSLPGRPAMPPPRPAAPANIVPPRQPLGTRGPIMPPRGTTPPPVAPTPRYNQGYAAPPPLPGYRPVDPGNRYAPPLKPPAGGRGGYAPPPGNSYNSQPRLNVPPMAQGYGGKDYTYTERVLASQPRPGGTYRPPDFNDGDLFDDGRRQPRATARDYSQAYRDFEAGYEEDTGRSRGPFIWLLLLGLALVILLGLFWAYYNFNSQFAGQTGQPPVVQAPQQPAKAEPETQAPAQAPQQRKIIYDRIVGDREVLGGDVMQSEEPPVAPADAVPPQTGGEELTPLPLPPPPGEGGSGDQQGSLSPTQKQDSDTIIPAAGESQAAAAPSYPPLPETDVYGGAGISSKAEPPRNTVAADEGTTPKQDPQGGLTLVASASGDAGSTEVPINTTSSSVEDPSGLVPPAPASASNSESISDDGTSTNDEQDSAASESTIEEEAPAPKPVKKAKPKKVVEKTNPTSLGSEPVVLVPPARNNTSQSDDIVVADTTVQDGTGGGLYSGEGLVDPAPAQQASDTTAQTPKKRRTLADLFRGEQEGSGSSAGLDNAIVETAPAPKSRTRTVAPAEADPPEQVAFASGFGVQLASFRSRDEANREYSRLRAKHNVLSGFSPVITEANVGGSTRYRLMVGSMPTREQASAVCAKLFAGGERDCLVKRM